MRECNHQTATLHDSRGSPRLGFEIECDGFVELDRSVPNIITDSRPLIYEFLVPQVEQQARVIDAIH
jgi:hypothetical protein